MSLTADLDSAQLSVLLDVRHPLAYLALRPAIELGRSREMQINWVPATVPVLKAPTATADRDGRGDGRDEDRGIRHRRNRAEAIAREIETYGAAAGLVLREYYRDGDADAGGRGWLWMRDRHRDRLEDYLSELFRAYWAVELDAARDRAVADLLDSLGADGAAFLAWSGAEGRVASAALAAELHEYGLFSVPAYVVDGEVFYGRQHLPMVRWILDGRSGRVPI